MAITSNDFLQMTDIEQQNFIDKITTTLINKKSTAIKYKKAYRKRKTATAVPIGVHQINGRLLPVCELQRTDVQDKKYYYLCQCDCGNWTIVRSDAFNNGQGSGGSASCGCLNKESYLKTFTDPIIQMKRLTNLKQYLDDIGIQVGDNIHGWQITQVDIKITEGNLHKKYVKGLCPYCKKESDWIRADGILSKTVHSCGCASESIGEQTIRELLTNAGIPFEQEKTFDSCRSPITNKQFRWDFYVNNKYLIEFDGKQHYSNSGRFTEEVVDKIKERDEFKNKWCIDNDIPLIRIPYTRLKTLQLDDLLLETTQFLYKGE